ncbi:calcium-binding protein [Gemmobacter denitrificans]|uniref:Calcium-binding protein n=1 Tax=Gemmobacter denitrificans TaxID=3123040 RepID=A0ABU8BQ52_9RHOB
MFKVRLVGNSLSSLVGEIYSAFDAGSSGSALRSGPDSNEVRIQLPPYTYVGVGLRGPDLDIDWRGAEMIQGTLTELRIESVRPTNGGGIDRVEYLRVTGFSVDPGPLMSFRGNMLGGEIVWSFDDAPLRAALNPRQGLYEGSRKAEHIGPVSDQFPGIFEMRGADTIRGWGGRDTLDGGRGDDLLLGGNGKDSLIGGAGHDLLDGGAHSDRLLGDAGNDSLTGGEGNDSLDGGLGKDTLSGGEGRDVLYGSWGDDLMTGGAGADQFHFRRPGHDRITDFSLSADQIWLSELLVPLKDRADPAAWLMARGQVTDEGALFTVSDRMSFLVEGGDDLAAIAAKLVLF